VFILGYRDDHQHGDENDHDHHHDHNLKAAYLHVLADALTSLLAIFALLTAKYLGLVWMDPFMGIVGAILVSRWSIGLIRDTIGVLLDKRGSDDIIAKLKNCIEKDESNRISDLHLWSVGPNIHAAIITIVSNDPKPVDHYKQLIPSDLNLVHVTIEVHRFAGNQNDSSLQK
jgi:cation diffusion facilitator family transporter